MISNQTESEKIRFRVDSGNRGGTFSTDSHTGGIFLNKQVDREEIEAFHLFLVAFHYETGCVASEGPIEFVVNILDVNDSPPQFNQSLYHVMVSENLLRGSVITQVTAEDADVGDHVTYTLLGGSNNFRVESNSGRILTTYNLSYSSHPTLYLTIIANDSKHVSSARILIDIIVDIRLTGSSPASMRGIVEIKHRGVWGTICGAKWSYSNSRIVCRQVGSVAVNTQGALLYRLSAQPWLLSHTVYCRETETRLSHCFVSGWKPHWQSCLQNVAIGVVCCDNPRDVTCNFCDVRMNDCVEECPAGTFPVEERCVTCHTDCQHGCAGGGSRKHCSLAVGEHYPAVREEDASGIVTYQISKNSTAFQLLVRNDNPLIDFEYVEGRFMTLRLRDRLADLAERVKSVWNGEIRLRVIQGWRSSSVNNVSMTSLYYQGRAVSLQLSDNDVTKTPTLVHLTKKAQFDWVKFVDVDTVYGSVIGEGCQLDVDLVFVIDSSGSIGHVHFQQSLQFVREVIDFFNVGENGTRVGVVVFTGISTVAIRLGE